jgi:hypothetical protein
MPERHDKPKRGGEKSEEIREHAARRDGTPTAGSFDLSVSDIESNPDAGFDFDTTPTDEEEARRSER